MNRLKIETGPRAGEGIDLATGGLTVGSDPSAATVAFEGAGLDSVHFRVAPVKGGGFGIQDLASKSGTSVNGKRVSAQRLTSGDRIVAGDVIFTFESTDPASLRAAAPVKPDGPVPQPDSGSAARPTASEPDAPKIAGYEIEGVLGRGGMGTVYRATQTSLHRTVALKVLSPALSRDPRFVEMFLREARAAAQLHHPNVVTIFDVGSSGDLHYFSMEVFEGGSVEQTLRREKKLEVSRALAYARDAARALEFAEAKRILHRDVKPDNLMISGHGVVKLADLGLAVRSGEAGAARLGTPHFLAPECIAGASPDHRADLYSLGATLFRMLTGRTPFQGSTVAEILENARTREAPLLRTVDATLSESVEALVARLLEKDPAKRPAHARDVVAEIDRILGTQAPAPTRARRIAIALASIAAAGLLLILLTRPRDAEPAKPVVVRDMAVEQRLRQEKEEKERALRESNAELALARIPESLTPSERIERLEALTREFAGTPAAAKATERAASIREDERRRIENEKARAETIQKFRSELEQRVQNSLTSGRFADALAVPRGLEGFEAAQDDADAKAAIDVVPERVSAAVESRVREELNRALALRMEDKFDAAQKAYEALAAELRQLAALSREEVGEARLERFKTLLTSIEGALKEMAHGREEWAARSLAAAAAAANAALRDALAGARAGKADGLTGLLTLDTGSLGSEAARHALAEAQSDARAFAQFLGRLLEVGESKSFGPEPFTDPTTGKAARIAGFDESGLRLEIRPGVPGPPIPLTSLGSAGVAALFARVAQKGPADPSLHARAALFAATAFDAARLVEAQRSIRLDAAPTPAPPEAHLEGYRAALEALRPDGGEWRDGSDALERRIEGERDAYRALHQGLTAFAAERYAEAERVLRDLSVTGEGTVVHFLASAPDKGSSAAASAPPR